MFRARGGVTLATIRIRYVDMYACNMYLHMRIHTCMFQLGAILMVTADIGWASAECKLELMAWRWLSRATLAKKLGIPGLVACMQNQPEWDASREDAHILILVSASAVA